MQTTIAGLWQTTLSANTISTQKKSNPTQTTPDQTSKEKPMNVDKGRTTRQVGTALTPNTNLGNIPDAETGQSWLDAKGLLAPSGVTPSLNSLVKALFQVGALPNTPLQMLNGI